MFAAPVVKIQKERAHTVITNGPYRYVRHPMYAGMIFYLFILRTSAFRFLVGASLGMCPARSVRDSFQIEEGNLRKELPGYNEYAVRVRYRLVPRVW